MKYYKKKAKPTQTLTHSAEQAMHIIDPSASKTGEKESKRIYTEEEKQKILYEYHDTLLSGH